MPPPSCHLRSAWAVGALAFAGLTTNAEAGAWMEPAGDGRAILTLRGTTADDYFNGDGNTASGPKFKKDDAELFVTYGVSDATTFVLQTSYVRLYPDSPAAGATGWDEIQIAIQHRVWEDDNQIVSVQMSVLAPGNADLTSGGVDLEARGL